jgi:hypothetical protein
MAFLITMPKSFKVGDTAPCRINHQPAQITWRDKDTLVIEPGDARRIVYHRRSGDLQDFTCADADGTTPVISYPLDSRKADSAEIKAFMAMLLPPLSDAEKQGLRYPLEVELNTADGLQLRCLIEAKGEPPVTISERSLLGIAEDCYPVATKVREWDSSSGATKGRAVSGQIVRKPNEQR